MKAKGFTLIELLVVIAIIGLLSSVVLASLNSARNRGRDAAVKSNLSTARSQAELFYPLYGRYGSAPGGAYYEGDCLTNLTMFRETVITGEARNVANNITAAIAAAYAAGNGNKQCRLDSARSAYMVAIGMKGTGTYWCIDSAGVAKDVGATLPASGSVECL